MGRLIATIALLTASVLYVNSSFGQTSDHLCREYYDKFRQMGYWASKVVSVSDYESGSGDAKLLKLVHESPDGILAKEASELIDHFSVEFERLVKGNIPFHDVAEGRDVRIKKALREYGGKHNFLEIFEAEEEARRRSLYGPYPGALYCFVRVDRHDFPVLYETECSIVANKSLYNIGGLRKGQLGYSSPEHIMGELKYSITMQLEKLGRNMNIIRSCR